MGVTVEIVGDQSREIDATGKCYGDLLGPFDLSEHEVSILVDGHPVPEDEPVDEDVEHVRVLRLIKGG